MGRKGEGDRTQSLCLLKHFLALGHCLWILLVARIVTCLLCFSPIIAMVVTLVNALYVWGPIIYKYFWTHDLICHSQTPSRCAMHVFIFLQRWKLRPENISSYIARKWQSQELNPGVLLPNVLYILGSAACMLSINPAYGWVQLKDGQSLPSVNLCPVKAGFPSILTQF